MLFFSGTEDQLAKSTQLVVDFPGGGFIAMGPECHEERLRRWAKRTGKPVLGVNYGKAPECTWSRTLVCRCSCVQIRIHGPLKKGLTRTVP